MITRQCIVIIPAHIEVVWRGDGVSGPWFCQGGLGFHVFRVAVQHPDTLGTLAITRLVKLIYVFLQDFNVSREGETI